MKAKSVGMFIILVIGILVGLVFLQATSNSVAEQSTIIYKVNQTITFPTNTTYVTLLGKAVSPSASSANVVAINATGGEVIATANYTISNYYNNNGALEARLYGRPTVSSSVYAGLPVNVSYAYESANYVTDSGSKTVIGLIVLFGALGILGFVIHYLFKSEDMQNILRMGGGAKVETVQ